MPTKVFLSIVALMYLALSIWCALDPQTTSAKVGFGLNGGAGQSEFLTIYGGLEFGMALVFLIPWAVKEATRFSLLACLLMHASLVVFRSIGFFAFADIDPFTYQLAIGEWAILILSCVFWFSARSKM